MKNVWALQDAKNRFSTVVDAAVEKGPQTITRHGEPTVVVISIDEFKTQRARKLNILELFEPMRGLDLENLRDNTPMREVEL